MPKYGVSVKTHGNSAFTSGSVDAKTLNCNRQNIILCAIMYGARDNILSVMLYGNKEEILKDVGARMRARRLRLNLLRAEVADRSGVCENTVKNFENGKGISLWGFISLCRTLGHDSWIYDLEPESVSDYADRIRPVKRRIRAAQGKKVADV